MILKSQNQWWWFLDHWHLDSSKYFLVSNLCGRRSSNGSNLQLKVFISQFWLRHARWNIILQLFCQRVHLLSRAYKTTKIERYKWQFRISWFLTITYSVTKKNLLESWKNSYNFKMLGWSRVLRILISPTSLSRSSWARCFLFIILTALKALDSLCKHFLTSPNAPI